MTKKLWVVVPAAGIGQRVGGPTAKQYLSLGSQAVIEHTLERLLSLPTVARVVVAIKPGDPVWPTLACAQHNRVQRVDGGDERDQSVANALAVLATDAQDDDWVLVHDAARPCILPSTIAALLAGIQSSSVGGLLARPASDTLKQAVPVANTQAHQANRVDHTIDRSMVWCAQTPQAFRYGVLTKALKRAAEKQCRVTDEASALELLGFSPLLIEGRGDNIKITHADDLALAEWLIERQRAAGEYPHR